MSRYIQFGMGLDCLSQCLSAVKIQVQLNSNNQKNTFNNKFNIKYDSEFDVGPGPADSEFQSYLAQMGELVEHLQAGSRKLEVVAQTQPEHQQGSSNRLPVDITVPLAATVGEGPTVGAPVSAHARYEVGYPNFEGQVGYPFVESYDPEEVVSYGQEEVDPHGGELQGVAQVQPELSAQIQPEFLAKTQQRSTVSIYDQEDAEEGPIQRQLSVQTQQNFLAHTPQGSTTTVSESGSGSLRTVTARVGVTVATGALALSLAARSLTGAKPSASAIAALAVASGAVAAAALGACGSSSDTTTNFKPSESPSELAAVSSDDAELRRTIIAFNFSPPEDPAEREQTFASLSVLIKGTAASFMVTNSSKETLKRLFEAGGYDIKEKTYESETTGLNFKGLELTVRTEPTLEHPESEIKRFLPILCLPGHDSSEVFNLDGRVRLGLELAARAAAAEAGEGSAEEIFNVIVVGDQEVDCRDACQTACWAQGGKKYQFQDGASRTITGSELGMKRQAYGCRLIPI